MLSELSRQILRRRAKDLTTPRLLELRTNETRRAERPLTDLHRTGALGAIKIIDAELERRA